MRSAPSHSVTVPEFCSLASKDSACAARAPLSTVRLPWKWFISPLAWPGPVRSTNTLKGSKMFAVSLLGDSVMFKRLRRVAAPVVAGVKVDATWVGPPCDLISAEASAGAKGSAAARGAERRRRRICLQPPARREGELRRARGGDRRDEPVGGGGDLGGAGGEQMGRRT